MSARAAAVAAEMLALHGTGRRAEPCPGLTMAEAYTAAGLVHAARKARGERPLGRKIGFTNRTIWPRYGVDGPIWGHMYDTTVHALPESFPLAGLAEPRAEPEIAFRLRAAPEPGMDRAALLGCIEAMAHGIEIVDSPFPGWRFAAPDTVAAHGLHAALLLGPWQAPDGAALAGFTLTLDGPAGTWTGHARDVLGGPVETLAFLAAEIARHGGPPLAAGEIVTTGTITDAMPVAPGERIATRLSGIALPGLTLRFT